MTDRLRFLHEMEQLGAGIAEIVDQVVAPAYRAATQAKLPPEVAESLAVELLRELVRYSLEHDAGD